MPYYGDTEWILTPFMTRRLYIIDDSSGNDWFNFSSWSGSYSYNLYIDLRPGTYYNPMENYDFGFRLRFTSTTWIENAIGGGGHDRMVGNDAANGLIGGAGDDRIWGLAGNDGLAGQDGADQLFGGLGNDRLSGNAGVDSLYGESGYDTLIGGTYSDYLYGGDHGDDLYGNEGSDRLYGGGGADRFLFNEVMTRTAYGANQNGETPLAAPDYILDFQNAGNAFGDVIGLSAIDANFDGYPNVNVNESFVFYGTGPIGGALRALWLRDEGGNSVVYGNTYGAYAADFKIVIADGAVSASQYTAADFVL